MQRPCMKNKKASGYKNWQTSGKFLPSLPSVCPAASDFCVSCSVNMHKRKYNIFADVSENEKIYRKSSDINANIFKRPHIRTEAAVMTVFLCVQPPEYICRSLKLLTCHAALAIIIRKESVN